MSSKPIVGVIIRSSDNIALLRRALDCVLDQTYQTWRLFLLSNKSINKEFETLISIYQERMGSRLTVVKNAESSGEDGAINSTLMNMEVDLVVIHDEDTWAPEFLERMISVYLCEKSNHPSIAGITCRCNRVLERTLNNLIITEHSEPLNSWLEPGLLAIEAILESDILPPASFLFELNICRNIGGYNDMFSTLCDWDFQIRFMMEKNIWVMPETLAFHHIQLNQVVENPAIDFKDKVKNTDRKTLINHYLRNDLKNGKFGVGFALAFGAKISQFKSN